MKLSPFAQFWLAIFIVIGGITGFGIMWDNPDKFFWVLMPLSFIGMCCTVFYLILTYTK